MNHVSLVQGGGLARKSLENLRPIPVTHKPARDPQGANMGEMCLLPVNELGMLPQDERFIQHVDCLRGDPFPPPKLCSAGEFA